MNEKSEWNIATYDAFLFPCQIKTLQKPVPVDDFRIRFFNKKTVSQKCGKKNTKLPQEHILSRYPVTLKSWHLHFWRAIALLHRHIIVSIQHPIGLRSTKACWFNRHAQMKLKTTSTNSSCSWCTILKNEALLPNRPVPMKEAEGSLATPKLGHLRLGVTCD